MVASIATLGIADAPLDVGDPLADLPHPGAERVEWHPSPPATAVGPDTKTTPPPILLVVLAPWNRNLLLVCHVIELKFHLFGAPRVCP